MGQFRPLWRVSGMRRECCLICMGTSIVLTLDCHRIIWIVEGIVR
jgi:hypothetical protein